MGSERQHALMSNIASGESDDDDSIDLFKSPTNSINNATLQLSTSSPAASNSEARVKRSFQPIRSMSPPVSPLFGRSTNLPRRATVATDSDHHINFNSNNNHSRHNNTTGSTNIKHLVDPRRNTIVRPSSSRTTNVIKIPPAENPLMSEEVLPDHHNRSSRTRPSFQTYQGQSDLMPQFFMSPQNNPRPQHQQQVGYPSPYMDGLGGGGGGGVGMIPQQQQVHHFHHQGGRVPHAHAQAPPPCCEHSAAAAAGKSLRPDYSRLDEEQTRDMKYQFNKKLLVLQTVVPKWKIMIPSETSSLDYFHDMYELYSKQITIYVNTFYLKIGLCFMFIVLQWSAGRAGVPMEGYAMSQIQTIGNYDCLLMELSEKYFSGGGGGEPMSIEQRFIYFAALQAIAFMFCNYVEKMTGSKQLSDYMKNFVSTNVIDKLKSNEAADPTAGLDNVGVPFAPGVEEMLRNTYEPAASGTSTAPPAPPMENQQQQQSSGGGGGGVMDIAKLVGSVSGLLNGNSGDVNGNLGNAFGGIMGMLGNLNNNNNGGGGGGGSRLPPTSPAPTSTVTSPKGPPRRMPSRPPSTLPPLSPSAVSATSAMSPPRSARRKPVFKTDPNEET